MAVVTALVTWNTKLGAFISLILLLLQLASSAGTTTSVDGQDFPKYQSLVANELLCFGFCVKQFR